MSDNSEESEKLSYEKVAQQEGGRGRKRAKKSKSMKSRSRSPSKQGKNRNTNNNQRGRGGCGSSYTKGGNNEMKILEDTISKAMVESAQTGGNLVENISKAISQINSEFNSQSGGQCFTATRGGKKTKKPSPYNNFVKKRMAEMKKTHPNLSAPEKMKRIGAEWKKKGK